MKKTILTGLTVCFCIAVVVAVVLFSNKTFMHDYYEVTNEKGQTGRITTLQYSFFVGEPEKHTAVFYRFGNKQDMQNQIYHYVEFLTSCYDDGAFCDTEQDITIYSYEVSEGFLLHKITLVYDTIDLKAIENATGVDIQTLVLNGEVYRLQQGDSYIANEWTGTPEYRLNKTTYEAPALTGRGITTGDPMEKVISAYNIKTDYALWEVESKPLSDGSYTIESQKYVTGELPGTDIQKATLVFAYYRLETQWVPLSYDEISRYISYLGGEITEKPYDGIMMFQFQFPINDISTNQTVAGFTVDFEPEQ